MVHLENNISFNIRNSQYLFGLGYILSIRPLNSLQYRLIGNLIFIVHSFELALVDPL